LMPGGVSPVQSVPAVDKARYYSVMLCDGNTFNYGYIRSLNAGIRRYAVELVRTRYADFGPAHF
jgi:hypothetical protein